MLSLKMKGVPKIISQSPD